MSETAWSCLSLVLRLPMPSSEEPFSLCCGVPETLAAYCVTRLSSKGGNFSGAFMANFLCSKTSFLTWVSLVAVIRPCTNGCHWGLTNPSTVLINPASTVFILTRLRPSSPYLFVSAQWLMTNRQTHHFTVYPGMLANHLSERQQSQEPSASTWNGVCGSSCGRMRI